MAFTHVQDAVAGGVVRIEGEKVVYSLHEDQSANWTEPDEWNRCSTIASLVAVCGFQSSRIVIDAELSGQPSAGTTDVVVFEDDQCTIPYLVIQTTPEKVRTSRPR
jgi:type I restriction enzyme M protein